jgi:hypothetical protein
MYVKFVAVIKELRRNDYGDASVLLKDPTGTIQGCISHKVLSDLKFGSNIGPGAVIILMKVAIFRPSPSAHYLNVTINNVVKVRTPQSQSATTHCIRQAC